MSGLGLQRLATGWRPRGCPDLQTQVREDLLDHGRLQDRCDVLQLATALRAVLQVEVEDVLACSHVWTID